MNEQPELFLSRHRNPNLLNREKLFVLQKYIERPFLFNHSKVTLKFFVLVDHKSIVHTFQEGYLKYVDKEYFILNQVKTFNPIVDNSFNSNNLFQSKKSEIKFISFHSFKDHLSKENGIKWETLRAKIKKIIKICLKSVKYKINKNQRKFCFEIFEFNFVLDDEFNPWLIKIKSFKNKDYKNEIVHNILNRLISDAFSLTISKLFDEYENASSDNIYIITSYSFNTNLWEVLCDLSIKWRGKMKLNKTIDKNSDI